MPPIAVLVALADPTRCRIIEILRDGPQPVHVLAGSFKISRPAISRHLRVLKTAKLIKEKKAGRENRYALTPQRLDAVRAWLTDFAPSDKTAIVVESTEAAIKPKPAPRKPRAVPPARPAEAVAPQELAALPEPVVVEPVVTKPVVAKPAASKPAASKPAADAPTPISQMGFDF